jgi:ABC-type histidine transport system ATPase subunit
MDISIEVEDLIVDRGGKRVLKGISFQSRQGA